MITIWFVWVLLWLPPHGYPVYMGVYSTYEKCGEDVETAAARMNNEGVFMCLHENVQ